ncbi:MAG: adenosine deaminase family protein [Pseudomonadota bacterium]
MWRAALAAAALLSLGACAGAPEKPRLRQAQDAEALTAAYFATIKDNPPLLRAFLAQMPKGADIHNHLDGGIYAEDFLAWAAEDGLCVDVEKWAILTLKAAPQCPDPATQMPAGAIVLDPDLSRQLINALSLRGFVPTPGWSGHDQFFASFARMGRMPYRLGDMLARAAEQAAAQNVGYLELMVTLGWDFYAWAARVSDAKDPAILVAELEAAGLGERLATARREASQAISEALARKDALLQCATPRAQAGCGVEIRLLHQVIRTLPPAGTFAGFLLGYDLTATDARYVGLNLVAPEDDPRALSYYDLHMAMLDYLWRQKGPRNIALHAGELTLGLVRPADLRQHIRKAIDKGHARRIGHGVAIVYEDDMRGLLARMQAENILVEVNLTSNDVILGVSGADHPITLYEAAGVPITLATDDEGVSRIDLSHEYQRAVASYGFGYGDVKRFATNALAHAFLGPEAKAAALADLEARFAAFEAMVAGWEEER